MQLNTRRLLTSSGEFARFWREYSLPFRQEEIFVKNDDGGWEEDSSNPYGPFNYPTFIVRQQPGVGHGVRIEFTIW